MNESLACRRFLVKFDEDRPMLLQVARSDGHEPWDLCATCLMLTPFSSAPTEAECNKCFDGEFTDRRCIEHTWDLE
jgi:hypothetical protein